MGNIFSQSTKCPSKDNDLEAKITDFDLTVYKKNRENIFWGTISICVFYALIAVLFITFAYFSPTMKYLLFERFLPFTIVYIIGTIIVICILFQQILVFKPISLQNNMQFPDLSCPDYFNMISEDETTINRNYDTKSIDKTLLSKQCVMDTDVYNKNYLINSEKVSKPYYVTNESTDNNIRTVTLLDDTTANEFNNSQKNLIYRNLLSTELDNFKITTNNNDKLLTSNIYDGLIENSLVELNYYKKYGEGATNSDATYDRYSHLSQDSIKAFDPNNRKNFDLNFAPSGTGSLINAITTGDNDIIDSTNDIIINKTKNKKYKNFNSNGTITNEKVTYADTSTANTSASPATNIPVICERLHPLLMAAKDKELSKKFNNKYPNNLVRCTYSKICNIPWSDLNCDMYNDDKTNT